MKQVASIATHSSETSFDFQGNTRGYIPEDRTFQVKLQKHYAMKID
jgi:hypothetical protein